MHLEWLRITMRPWERGSDLGSIELGTQLVHLAFYAYKRAVNSTLELVFFTHEEGCICKERAVCEMLSSFLLAASAILIMLCQYMRTNRNRNETIVSWWLCGFLSMNLILSLAESLKKHWLSTLPHMHSHTWKVKYHLQKNSSLRLGINFSSLLLFSFHW